MIVDEGTREVIQNWYGLGQPSPRRFPLAVQFQRATLSNKQNLPHDPFVRLIDMIRAGRRAWTHK